MIEYVTADKDTHEAELAQLVKKSSWKFLKEFPFVWVRYEGWKNTPPLIAIEDGKIVGFYAAMHLKSTYANMYYVYVAPESQGRGIARELMNRGIQEAVAKGLTRLTWKVLKENPGAIAFYAKLGFLPIATTNDELVYDIKVAPYVDMDTLKSEALSSSVYDTDENPISTRRRNQYLGKCRTEFDSISNKFKPIPVDSFLETGV